MYFSRITIRPDVRDLHLLISGNGYGAHQLLWKLFPAKEGGRSFLFREEIASEQIPFHKGVKGEPVFYTVSAAPPLQNHPVFAAESKPYAPKLSRGDRLAFRLRANPTIARRTEGKKNCVRHDVVMDAQRELLAKLAMQVGIVELGKKLPLKLAILASGALTAGGQITHRLQEELEGNEQFRATGERNHSPAALLDLGLKASADKALESWFRDKGDRNGFSLVRDDRKDRLKFQALGYQWHALPKKGKTAGFSSVDFEGVIEVVDPDCCTEALVAGIGPAKGFGCGLMLVRRV